MEIPIPCVCLLHNMPVANSLLSAPGAIFTADCPNYPVPFGCEVSYLCILCVIRVQDLFCIPLSFFAACKVHFARMILENLHTFCSSVLGVHTFANDKQQWFTQKYIGVPFINNSCYSVTIILLRDSSPNKRWECRCQVAPALCSCHLLETSGPEPELKQTAHWEMSRWFWVSTKIRGDFKS